MKLVTKFCLLYLLVKRMISFQINHILIEIYNLHLLDYRRIMFKFVTIPSKLSPPYISTEVLLTLIPLRSSSSFCWDISDSDFSQHKHVMHILDRVICTCPDSGCISCSSSCNDSQGQRCRPSTLESIQRRHPHPLFFLMSVSPKHFTNISIQI